jgi:uncharacterized protein YjbI with pentapeptide repeats
MYFSHALIRLGGRLVVLTTVITYLTERSARIEAQDNQAWTLIMLAEGKSGDGGRKSAIQRLYKDNSDLTSLPLRNAAIQYLDLTNANITNSDFRNANIEGITLNGAQVNRSNFAESTMDVMNFNNAEVTRANFYKAIISDSWFKGTDLYKTDFRDAIFFNLDAGSFDGADLTEVNFEGARFLGDLVDWPSTEELAELRKRKPVMNPVFPESTILCGTTMPDGMHVDRDCARANRDRLSKPNVPRIIVTPAKPT